MLAFILLFFQITLKCSWHCLSPYANLNLKAESVIYNVCKIWIFMCVYMYLGFHEGKENLESENEKWAILLLFLVISLVRGLHSVSGGMPDWAHKWELGDGCQRYPQIPPQRYQTPQCLGNNFEYWSTLHVFTAQDLRSSF